MISRLEAWIVKCPPERRRRMAIHVLLWSVVLMFVNDIAYLLEWINDVMLIFVTLNLSWLALTVTAVDVVMTTDVRANE